MTDPLADTVSLDAAQSRALFWPELKRFPRPEYLVKGVIDRGAFAEIYGAFGTGKSFLATDIGIHVAAGWDWQGHRVRQAGVLYVSAEGGAIVNRLDAWQRHHGEALDDIAFACVIEPTTLLDPQGVEQVLIDAQKVPDLGLVFIDTAARVMPGTDEGAEDMGKLVSACDRIRAELGVAVCVVHHSGKDASRGSRGSTVLPAAVDTAIEVTRDEVSKVGAAKTVKQRDGASGPLLNFMLKVVELDLDEDGDPITSCVIETTDKIPAKRMTSKQVRAVEVLNDVLIDHGKPAPEAKHYPTGVEVVRVDLWREYLFNAGVLDKEASNPRQDFRRLKDQLAERSVIAEWDGLVWAVKNG